ncbi:MAG TPA: hypothetical protein VHM67_04380 [Gemmatimonadaceae bacterium]|nr:hypothetical protein [Gemmatimonadaceae bacterium]
MSTSATPGSFADSAPTACSLCGEPVDASQTAVAVMRADGTPGLVHPGCYPEYSAQQRALGNSRVAESPLRDLGESGASPA